jgi:hypothetical protein
MWVVECVKLRVGCRNSSGVGMNQMRLNTDSNNLDTND